MAENNKNTMHDNAIGWVIMFVIFAAIAGVIWYFYAYQIKDILRWIRWGQLWLFSQILPSSYEVMWNGTAVNYDQSVQDIKNIPQSSLSNEILGLISYMAMQPLKWPVTVALAAMSIWALFKGPGTQFRRTLDINGLIEVQSNNFQGIRPFKNFNPSNIPPRPPGAPVPAELPPFAEALGPEEWLAYNEIPIPDGNLDEKVTLRALADQLGPRWRGVKYLPEYKQILMAAFCLRAVRKRNESEDLLGRASACWSEAKGFRASTDKSLLKDARRILADKKISGDTIANCNQHGFENTAMLRGLQTAREEGGVLAPATFIWVRAHDRPLWYAMNNLGRQAYHTEALGTMAHYKSERRTSRPIPRPKLDDALTTVRDYVGSAKLRPIPQLDYSASKKKRGVKKPKK